MKKEPIAVYVMSNTMALQIFDINDEEVLVGTSYEEAETSEIHYSRMHDDVDYDDDDEESSYFMWGELPIFLSECMRTNF
jgi:hypothetical protein